VLTIGQQPVTLRGKSMEKFTEKKFIDFVKTTVPSGAWNLDKLLRQLAG
jgi:hypothetical protein